MNKNFDVKIIGTGSDGNSIVIDDKILIDAGLSWKVLSPYLTRKITAVFITHEHGDHCNPSIFNRIAQNRPALLKATYVNKSTYHKLELRANKAARLIPEKNILHEGTVVNIKRRSSNYQLKTYKLVHDVENYGLVFTNLDTGKTLIHATDTETMKYAPEGKYDTLLIEGNYEEERLDKAVVHGTMEEKARAMRNIRHLSIQEMEDFVKTHSHSKSIVIQLHESKDFGVTSPLDMSRELDVYI